MDYFLKTYKALCRQEFGIYGFRSYRKNFYRAVNDVYQSFCLHRSIYGTDCTVEFTVLPLCIGYPIDKSTCGPSHLKNFEGSFAWFPYDRRSKESIDACIAEMLAYMKKYLIPFFQASDCCKTAYDAIRQFELQSHQNHRPDSPEKNFSLFSSVKAWIAVKNGDYALAARHFQEIERQTLDAMEYDRRMSGSDDQKKSSQNQKLADIREKIHMLLTGDEQRINSIVLANEHCSLQSLQ